MKTKNGSVLIFCMLVLSAIVLLTELLIRGVFVGNLFTKTMIEREHAEMLALSGIQLAIAQLTINPKEVTKEEEAKKESAQTAEEKAQKLGEVGKEVQEESLKTKLLRKKLTQLIPTLNRWQIFKLTEKIDGIDGQIQFCVSCEHGKININEIFDFKKQELKKEYDALLKMLELKIPDGSVINLHDKIIEFLKTRSKKLDDITELISIQNLDQVNVFYVPPQMPDPKSKEFAVNKKLAIQDLFTIWTDDDKIDPMMCSDSICQMLTLRRPHADDPQNLKAKYNDVIKNFKQSWYKDWEGNWKNVQDIFGEIPKFWKDIKGIFTKEFGPKVYSVLSYGKVGNVEQRLLAVIKEVEESSVSEKTKKEKENEQNKTNTEKQEKKPKTFFKIVRIYWL